MYKLKYFSKGDLVSLSEFNNKGWVEHIRLQNVYSFSGIRFFKGKPDKGYCTVRMNNGDKFCIHEEEYNKLCNAFYSVEVTETTYNECTLNRQTCQRSSGCSYPNCGFK